VSIVFSNEGLHPGTPSRRKRSLGQRTTGSFGPSSPFFVVSLFACNQNTSPANNATSKISADSSVDKQEITQLIRQMLNWKEAKGRFEGTPPLENATGSTLSVWT
jgi:hypothetical protein